MNNSNGFTLKDLLSLVVAVCLLRFGLVMTSGFEIFSLPIVIFLGAGTVLLYAFFDHKYAGRFLQVNTFFLGANILFVFLLKELATRTRYIAEAKNYINQLIVLWVLWGVYQFLRMQSLRTQKALTSLYLTSIGISTIYTLYVAINGHETIIRDTASGKIDTSFPFRYGGFDFVYALVLVYGILFTILVQDEIRIKQRNRLCIALLLAVISITIVVSGFSTAFTLILIFTILNVSKKRSVKMFWLLAVATAVFVLPELLVKLIESIPFMPEITSSRIGDMLLSFTGRGSSSYISEEGQRLDRIFWSLEAFAAHPLLGIVGGSGAEKLGYHTEWLDQLARYGVATAFFNATFWIGTYRRMKRGANDAPVTVRCVKNAFLLYLVLGFLNPISMVVTAAPLFVLCPFVEKLFQEDRR